jgi:hypothetical protein
MKQKIPALRALLTEFEFAHVQAFPSVLRLLYHGAHFAGFIHRITLDPSTSMKPSSASPRYRAAAVQSCSHCAN